MAPRVRSIVWAVSAQTALDDVITYISQDSREGAARVLEQTLDAAATLATLAERGRIVPESNDSAIREVFVFHYRLMYEIHNERVVIVAFVHGARDFTTVRRNLANQ